MDFSCLTLSGDSSLISKPLSGPSSPRLCAVERWIHEPSFVILADGLQRVRHRRRRPAALLPPLVAAAIPLHCVCRAKVPLPLFTSVGTIPPLSGGNTECRAACRGGGCRRAGEGGRGRSHTGLPAVPSVSAPLHPPTTTSPPLCAV